MLKRILTTVAFVPLLAMPLAVVAKETTTDTPLRDRVETRRENVDERRSAVQEERQERREQLVQERKERIRAFFERMLKRMRAGFLRMERFIERLEARIAKLEEVNKNIETSEAKLHIAEARAHVAKGRSLLDSLPAEVESLINTEGTFREKFEAFKAKVKEAGAELRAAHRSLVEAVKSIKAAAGLREGGGAATSTATE